MATAGLSFILQVLVGQFWGVGLMRYIPTPYMGAANIREIAAKLVAEGMPAELPVLAVASGTTPREQRLVSCLSTIAVDAADAQFSGPVLFVIGKVVSLYRSCPAEVLAMLAAQARSRVTGERDRHAVYA